MLRKGSFDIEFQCIPINPCKQKRVEWRIGVKKKNEIEKLSMPKGKSQEGKQISKKKG